MTIVLVYALMVVSAQLRLGGFYTRTAFWITSVLVLPRFFLLVSMLLSYLLLCWLFRKDFHRRADTPDAAAILQTLQRFDRWQSIKGLVVVGVLLALLSSRRRPAASRSLSATTPGWESRSRWSS